MTSSWPRGLDLSFQRQGETSPKHLGACFVAEAPGMQGTEIFPKKGSTTKWNGKKTEVGIHGVSFVYLSTAIQMESSAPRLEVSSCVLTFKACNVGGNMNQTLPACEVFEKTVSHSRTSSSWRVGRLCWPGPAQGGWTLNDGSRQPRSLSHSILHPLIRFQIRLKEQEINK